METNLQDLLRKEISRKEFLRTVGLGVVSLMGLSALLKLAHHTGHGSGLSSSHGYGASPYGR